MYSVDLTQMTTDELREELLRMDERADRYIAAAARDDSYREKAYKIQNLADQMFDELCRRATSRDGE